MDKKNSLILPLIQLRGKAQVTLPAKVRQILGLKEGDYLRANIEGDIITLKPVKTVDKSETWFWSKEWQEGERRVDEDLKAGRYTVHKTPEDFLKSLE